MNRFSEAKSIINYDYSDVITIENLSNRRLYINCDIDQYIADEIVNQILDINRDDLGKPVEDRKPIILYCTSSGGSVIDGFSIIDSILSSTTPIITVNLAYQYSMGFLIGLAGSKRYGAKNSTYLLHDGQNMAWDSSAKVRDQLKFEEQREERIKNFVLSRTKITEEQYKNNYRVEWYMFPEEAKKFNVINGIIGEDISFDEIL